jgi:hypothetical protein
MIKGILYSILDLQGKKVKLKRVYIFFSLWIILKGFWSNNVPRRLSTL